MPVWVATITRIIDSSLNGNEVALWRDSAVEGRTEWLNIAMFFAIIGLFCL